MFLGEFHQQVVAFHKVGTYDLPVVILVYIDSAKQSIRFISRCHIFYNVVTT